MPFQIPCAPAPARERTGRTPFRPPQTQPLAPLRLRVSKRSRSAQSTSPKPNRTSSTRGDHDTRRMRGLRIVASASRSAGHASPDRVAFDAPPIKTGANQGSAATPNNCDGRRYFTHRVSTDPPHPRHAEQRLTGERADVAPQRTGSTKVAISTRRPAASHS